MIFLVGCSEKPADNTQNPAVETESETKDTPNSDSSVENEGETDDEVDGEEGQVNHPEKQPENGETAESSDLATIYSIALEAIMPVDDALNEDMTYIAINGGTLVDATDEDMQTILSYFNKYNVEVKNTSFKELEEEGLVQEGNYIEGILLEIDDVESKTDDKVVLNVSKFRSGLGAIGIKATIIKEKAGWKLESTEETWIS